MCAFCLFVCCSDKLTAVSYKFNKRRNHTIFLITFHVGIVEKLLLQGVYVGDAMLRAVDIGLPETVQKIGEFAETMPVRPI